jgi:hypothetical protein
MHANVQVVAPERVVAYEPNGHRTPLGWARTIVLMAVVMGILNVEAFDVFVHGDRRFGRWWTSGLLLRRYGRRRADREMEKNCWKDGDDEGDDS